MEDARDIRLEALEKLRDQGVDFEERDLLKCIEAGDLATLDLFLQAGMPLKRTAGVVVASVRSWQASVVDRVLEGGGNPNECDTQGCPAVILAAREMKEDIVKRLLDAGADSDAKEIGDRTALMVAAEGGSNNAMSALINAGADLQLTDSQGRTALMIAAHAGRLESVELLIRKGANLALKDLDGRTALDLATLAKRAETVNLLRKAERGEIPVEREETARHQERSSKSKERLVPWESMRGVILGALLVMLAASLALVIGGKLFQPKLPPDLDPPPEQAARATLQFGVETIEFYRMAHGKPPENLREVFLEGRGVPFTYKAYPDGHYTLGVSLPGGTFNFDSSKGSGIVPVVPEKRGGQK